jgi:hypothetical protein
LAGIESSYKHAPEDDVPGIYQAVAQHILIQQHNYLLLLLLLFLFHLLFHILVGRRNITQILTQYSSCGCCLIVIFCRRSRISLAEEVSSYMCHE